MFAFLAGIILFIISIPLKTVELTIKTTDRFAKIKEKLNSDKSKDSSKNKSTRFTRLKAKLSRGKGSKPMSKTEETKEKSKKVAKVTKTFIKLGAKALKMLVMTLRILASFLASFGLITIIIVLLVMFLLVGAVGYVAVVMNQDNLGNYASGTSSGTTSSTTQSTASADVQKIIDMSDAEVWKLISEGKYSSYSDANAACKANPTTEESFWSGLLVDVEVPCWKWADDSKTSKKDSTTTIKVNKYLADYFKSFMTDLYNLPEKYVIVDIGGFSFRTKNNASSSGNYSGHSFGATLDINWSADGMGSVPAGISNGHPWKTSNGLSDPLLSECCTYDNSWHELAKKYNFDWGGNWSEGSLDPMHFSLVGDNNKDSRKFENKYEGRTP